MSTSRPFAYNLGSQISGTIQVGDLAVGYPTTGFTGGMEWWNGPDEELGYVIAHPVPDDSQPTPVFGQTASLGFFRTNGFDDSQFVEYANLLTNNNYNNAIEAATGLTDNGFWNSYIVPVLSLDAGNPASYPGSGNTWTDMIGGKVFTLYNNPSYNSVNGGLIKFESSFSQYAQCNNSLPNLSNWTVGVWHYYTGLNSGSYPTIITEVYPSTTNQINYSLGDNFSTGLSAGFFDGAWRYTPAPGYNLTPNNWYYIVGTYDGSQIKLYINNVMVGYVNYSAIPISGEKGIRLMRRWDDNDCWGGNLAIVSIYDKALNDSQINSIWLQNKTRFGL